MKYRDIQELSDEELSQKLEDGRNLTDRKSVV